MQPTRQLTTAIHDAFAGDGYRARDVQVQTREVLVRGVPCLYATVVVWRRTGHTDPRGVLLGVVSRCRVYGKLAGIGMEYSDQLVRHSAGDDADKWAVLVPKTGLEE